MKTTNVSTLQIHKLSQLQYNRLVTAGEIDENAIYLTPDTDTGSGGSVDLPLARGEGENALIIGEGIATGAYSIAGGTNDTSALAEIVGSSMADRVTLSVPEAKGPNSIAIGSNAEATTSGAVVIGTLTRVGVKGLYFSSFNTTNKTITLSQSRRTEQGSNLPESFGWAIGDTISIIAGGKFPAYTTIEAISGNTITVKSLPTDMSSYSWLKESTYVPEDFTVCAFYKKTIASYLTESEACWYPREGEVEIGYISIGAGLETLVSGSASFAAGYKNWAASDYSAVFGKNNTAGYCSFAAGDAVTALGRYATATGLDTDATGTGSVALNGYTKATGNWSTAQGFETGANGKSSHAEGHKCATGKDAEAAHAEGRFTQASAPYSHTEGKATATAWNAYGAHVSGIGTKANAEAQYVVGKFNELNANAAFILGNGTGTIDNTTGAISNESRKNSLEIDWDGNATFGSWDADHDLHIAGGSIKVASINAYGDIFAGNSIKSAGDISTAGYIYTQENKKVATEEYVNSSYTVAGQKSGVTLGSRATAEGNTVEAKGTDSHAEGNKTVTEEGFVGAHAEGGQTRASGHYSHTEGFKCKTYASGAHAEGYETEAHGEYSHAGGYRTVSYGAYSYTGGYSQQVANIANLKEANVLPTSSDSDDARRTKALNLYELWKGSKYTLSAASGSYADGINSLAAGRAAHAEGEGCAALGDQSHAEGLFTVAKGTRSYAHGRKSIASGYSAWVAGEESEASGNRAYAAGLGIKATRDNSFIVGHCNEVSDYAIFAVGNGKFELDSNGDLIQDTIERSNAFAVLDTDGELSIQVGSTVVPETKLKEVVEGNINGMPTVDENGNALDASKEYIAKFTGGKWVAVEISIYNGEVV